MAISSTIVLTDPDGSSITISQLDDAIRLAKTEVSERMSGMIDTGVTSWASTTEKEWLEGIARVFVDTADPAAAAGHTLQEGELYVKSNANNTDAFKAYRSAAWNHVLLGTANLLTDAVTTVKLATGAPASTARAVSIWQTELTDVDANSDATTTWSTPASIAALTFTLTPETTNSIMCFYCTGHHYMSTGAGFGGVRIRKTTVGATGAKTLAIARTLLDDPNLDFQQFSLFGWFSGETAAMTVAVQVAKSSTGTYVLDGSPTLDGDTMPIRFGAYEVKR